MNNNLKKLEEEREAMLPPELENRIAAHAGTMAYFGNMMELFVPNALQVVVRMIGGEDMPCLKRGKKKEPAPVNWRTPPPAGPGEPGSHEP